MAAVVADSMNLTTVRLNERQFKKTEPHASFGETDAADGTAKMTCEPAHRQTVSAISEHKQQERERFALRYFPKISSDSGSLRRFISMKRFYFSVFLIFTAFLIQAAAQTAEHRKEFELGVKLARENRFEPARDVFSKLLEAASVNEFDAPFRAKLHYNLGACEFRLGESRRAVAEFESAIKLADGDYEKALYALGMAHTDLGNWTSAEAAFHRALRLNAKNGEVWFDLAFVYLELNETANAFTAFENAVRNKSTASAYALNNLGVIAARRGQITEATRFFEKALEKSGGKLQLAKDNLEFTNGGAIAKRP